jgi:hypothetical protein
LGDLTLLQKKLQSEQIHCSQPVRNLGFASFLVESNDFARANAVAAKIISENSLTVNIEADMIGLGLEIWEKGRETSTVYF